MNHAAGKVFRRMERAAPNPNLRLSTLLACALALSIGWGIRGNFGHEYGAMIPGALAAMAGCLLSGREDWRKRVAYFAFFGALGWGFGGSISYMQVIGYTHSGDWPTMIYGYAGLFLIGYLWGGLGAAGTALPAVATREHLTELFRPLLWIFGVWLLWLVFGESIISQFAEGFDSTDYRHKYPTYWFDADWIPALLAVVAVGLFDLWDTALSKPGRLALVPAILAGGALLGFGLQQGLAATGLDEHLASVLVHQQGDVTLFDEAHSVRLTERQTTLVTKYNHDGAAFDQDLYTNWPAFFEFKGFKPHIGWTLGLCLAWIFYFGFFGALSSGSRLFFYMAVGWLASFVLFPVLLGVRLTPPRGDDWAGILGVYAGMLIYMLRYGFIPVVYASVVGGVIGGIGFSGAAFLKLMMVRPGNPNLTTDPDAVAQWAHWQGANWHSFLEQGYGFINGLGIAVVFAILAVKTKPVNYTPPVRRWTEAFSIIFVLLYLVYVNWRKAVGTWVDAGAVPEQMKMPLFESVEMSAEAWFSTLFWIAGAGIVALVVRIAARRKSVDEPLPSWPWFQAFLLATFGLLVMGNRAVDSWEASGAVAESMKMPLFESVEMPTFVWYLSVYWIVTGGFTVLIYRHNALRGTLAPATTLGKGQLMFITFLWTCTFFNLLRA